MSAIGCECCNLARADKLCNYFADRCTHCAARRIQYLRRVLVLGDELLRKRCKAVIADVNEWGLDEAEVRRLAKLPDLALRPVDDLTPLPTKKQGRR